MVRDNESEKTVKTLRLLPLALSALGCHVFSPLVIPCTEGMPCATVDTESDTDTDTDTDADTDADSDTDTDTEPADPTQGYAVSYAVSGAGAAIVYEPDGSERRRWSGYSQMTGPIAYAAATDTAYVFQADQIAQLYPDDSVSYGSVGFHQTFDADIDTSTGYAWVDFGTDVGIFDLTNGSQILPFAGALIDSRGLVVVSGTAFIVDNNENGPDAYQCDSFGNCSRTYLDFDSTAARGRNVFMGPGGEPYGCTGAGAVYALRDLADGNTSPTAFYDGASLTDVTDCAWDGGSEQFLLFSPSNGVIRMNQDSTGEVATPIPAGSTGARAHFYTE